MLRDDHRLGAKHFARLMLSLCAITVVTLLAVSPKSYLQLKEQLQSRALTASADSTSNGSLETEESGSERKL